MDSLREKIEALPIADIITDVAECMNGDEIGFKRELIYKDDVLALLSTARDDVGAQESRLEWSKTQTITCPKCDHKFDGTVEKYTGEPWARWCAECPQCGYYILESEWEPVKHTRDDAPSLECNCGKPHICPVHGTRSHDVQMCDCPICTRARDDAQKPVAWLGMVDQGMGHWYFEVAIANPDGSHPQNAFPVYRRAAIRDDAGLGAVVKRLYDCLRNLTDGTGDGYGPHIAEGRQAVIDNAWLDSVSPDHIADASKKVQPGETECPFCDPDGTERNGDGSKVCSHCFGTHTLPVLTTVFEDTEPATPKRWRCQTCGQVWIGQAQAIHYYPSGSTTTIGCPGPVVEEEP